MDNFSGRVAVVTGASMGLGRCLAWNCARLGMKVVLVGSNQARIEQAARDLETEMAGAAVLPVQADVSKPAEMDRLAQTTWETFGGAHLVINNAGVCLLGSPLDNTLDEWQWLMGINFWGVFNSIRAFVPRMLEQGEEGHIVTISSTSGLTSGAAQAAYHASKHAVFSLTESLYYTLHEKQSKIGVSVAAPGWVRTSIGDFDRDRPQALVPAERSPQQEEQIAAFREKVASGLEPERVAELVLEGVRRNQLYILTHPGTLDGIRDRFENILNERNPAH